MRMGQDCPLKVVINWHIESLGINVNSHTHTFYMKTNIKINNSVFTLILI